MVGFDEKSAVIIADTRRVNVGDDLLLHCFAQYLYTRGFTDIGTVGVSSLSSVRAIAPWKAIIMLLIGSWRGRRIYLGPGGIFFESLLNLNLLYYFLFSLVIKLSGSSYSVCGSSVDDLRGFFAKELARFILAQSDEIEVRDNASKLIVQKLLGHSAKVYVRKDYVDTVIQGRYSAIDCKNKTALIIPTWTRQQSVYGDDQMLIENLCRLMSYLITMGYEIQLIPFHRTKDLVLCNLLKCRMDTQAVQLHSDFTLDELEKTLIDSALCITMRLHSVIMASKFNRNVSCILYSSKVEAYVETFDLPYVEFWNLYEERNEERYPSLFR